MNHSRKTLNFAAGLLSGMLFSTVALGDDIDIYAAGNDVSTSHGKPNILFIIDTSGSMTETATGSDGAEENEFANYDPAIEYLGECPKDPDGEDYLYFTANDPDTSDPEPENHSLGISCSSSQRIPTARYHCGVGITEIATNGFASKRTHIQWRINSTTYQWRGLTSSPGSPSLIDTDVDCFEDHVSANHGHRETETVDPTEKPYAKDNSDMTTTEKDSLVGVWTSEASHAESFSLSSQYYFYPSNYMNWYKNYRPGMNRITAIKHALTASSTDPDKQGLLRTLSDVSVGFMRFEGSGNDNGGMVIQEMIEIAGNKQALIDIVTAIDTEANTPLTETYVEGLRYYMGESLYFGSNTKLTDADGNLVAAPSVTESRDPDDTSRYQSPISYECQMNHIVLLTDGEPTNDGESEDALDTLPSWGDGDGENWTPNCYSGDGKTVADSCLDDAAAYGYLNDISPESGKQNVRTHVIGFDINTELLNTAATKGGGKYYSVTNSKAFKEAVQEIIADVIDLQSSFTAPAVSVNAFNRTRHLDDLYFTLFAPDSAPHWDGNLKKFEIKVINGVAQIVGADEQPAVDETSGFFKDTATSHWTPSSESPDGGEASLGGASSKLPINRTIYTDAASPGDLVLTSFDVANTAITDTALGVPALLRDDHIKWIRGIDVDDADGDSDVTESRRARNMGDPLHSRPAVINYGGTAENPDATIFFGTNDGLLHAVDADTGVEQLAFIPKSLWLNFKTLRSNSTGTYKVYGIDTAIVPKIKDVDQDGIIESGDGDFVHIYFGTRRGGRYYYGLDVTDRGAPSLLWTIEGGIVGGNFEELGYTFAEPVPGRVLLNGNSEATDVLFLSGGYDTSTQDDETAIVTNDTMGRALFVINAKTGDLIWWAGPGGSGADLELPKMTNAIPAPPVAIDLNGDDITDRLYVGDLGGRVWRFDVRDVQSAPDNSGLLSGGLIASLGAAHLGSPVMADHRRFTNSPDIALVSDRELGRYLTIAIGSGEREHPNEKGTTNRFYVLKDHNVDNAVDSANYATEYGTDGYTHTSFGTPVLLDLSITALDSESTTDITDAKNSKGWFMDMPSTGEKVLAEAVTIRDQLVFTTFTPTVSSGSCDPGIGLGRIYAVSLKYASAIFDNNGDDTIDENDRSQDLSLQGIPPSLTILFPEATNGEIIGLVGTEDPPIRLRLPPERTYWYEQTETTE